MSGHNRTRVVVTGVGVVSPIGIGNDRFWESLVANRSGIDFLQSVPTEGLPSAFDAEVRDFNPVELLRDRKFVKVMCRGMQLGVASANLAEIVKKLMRRYNRTLRNVKQFDADEVIQFYLSALGHAYDPHTDYFGKQQLDTFSINMNLSLFGIEIGRAHV